MRKDIVTEKKKICIVIGLTLLVFSLALAVWIIMKSRENMQQDRIRGMLKIETPYLSGQGVLYQYEGAYAYIITAGHMMLGLSEGMQCTAYFPESGERQVTVYACSETADLAILRIEKEQLSLTEKAAVTDKAYFDALKEGDKIRLMTYDEQAESPFICTEGILTTPWIYLDEDDEAAILPLSVIASEWENIY